MWLRSAVLEFQQFQQFQEDAMMLRQRTMPWLVFWPILGLAALLLAFLATGSARATPHTATTYQNPVVISVTVPTATYRIENFPDPSIIQGNDGYYYAYATGDALYEQDRDPSGNLRFHHMPMARSTDLVNWGYIGDVFTSTLPGWIDPTAGTWAPDIRYFNGQYYLYYMVTDTSDGTSGEPGCHSDSAIGVATSSSPAGPWTDHGQPIVLPRRNGPGCNFFTTFDPAFLQDSTGQRYVFFGSYYGGIHARTLSPDGFTADPASDVQITIPNRYEAPFIVQHGGYYYLFASATNCCNGPLTGYSVFAGRSTNPLGPYLDREGVSMLETRVGGTPVISMNGNRWVGPGHNAVIADQAGQDWFYYHAIDQGNAYFAAPNPFNINKRQFMMDPLNWINGWPMVRSGLWASDSPPRSRCRA